MFERPTYYYRHAANLLVVTKHAEWRQLADRNGWHANILVTGQAIATIGSLHRHLRIEDGFVCESSDLFHRTGQILVSTRQGLSLKVYPDELWEKLVATFLIRPRTKG